MCLRYHLTLFPERPVNRVIFMGGESVELALCTRIAQVVGAPAFIGNPFSRLKRTGSEKLTGVERLEDASGWEVPIGLCSCRTVEAA